MGRVGFVTTEFLNQKGRERVSMVIKKIDSF